jgi:hypothetical protein
VYSRPSIDPAVRSKVNQRCVGVFAAMRKTTAGPEGTGTRRVDGDWDLWLARSRIARALLSRSPAFRILMFGSSISMLGTRISTVAFPMLVLRLSGSPFIAGVAAFAAIAPSLFFYVPAGIFVDHHDPRRVMLFSELSRGLAVMSLVIALLIYGMHVNISFLILVMMAEEILEIFSTLADRRYLCGVMEPGEAASKQASVEVRTHAVVLAGRPTGPFLFMIKPFLPFLADAVSFLASVASLLVLIKIDEPKDDARLVPARELGDIGRGFDWLNGDSRAKVNLSVMAAASMVAQALILIFLVEAHSRQLSTVAIGVVLGASGVGGAAGAFSARRVPAAIRGQWPPVQMTAWILAITFLVLMGGHSTILSALVMFILGFTGAIGNVEFGTYLVGRAGGTIATITGFGQMLGTAACALGSFLGGYTLQQLGLKGALWILLGITAVIALYSLKVRAVMRR